MRKLCGQGTSPSAGNGRDGNGKANHPRPRQQERRNHNTQLVQHLERLLPAQFRSGARPNGAGARSIGGKGRALNDVLEDVLQYVAHRRNVQPSPASAVKCKCEITRELLFSAQTMLCFEVEMGGQQDWIVTDGGRGAEQIWGAAPWLGGMVGHSFSQLVHRKDFSALEELWKRTCTALQGSARANPAPVSTVVRVLTFTYESLGRGQPLHTCSYQAFELQLHPQPNTSAVFPFTPHRVLVVGTLAILPRSTGAAAIHPRREVGLDHPHETHTPTPKYKDTDTHAGSMLDNLMSPENLMRVNGIVEFDFSNNTSNGSETITPSQVCIRMNAW